MVTYFLLEPRHCAGTIAFPHGCCRNQPGNAMFHHPRNWRSSQLPCIPWDWIYPAFFFQLLKFEIVNLCQTEQGIEVTRKLQDMLKQG